jgi:hypothetical protein
MKKGRSMQSTKLALIGACGVASLGLGSLAAEAAPAASHLNPTLAAAVGTQSATQDVAYRRCWWRNGQRHCRGSERPYRGYGYRYYGPLYPEAYRTGSSRWWQEMDRDDRGGRGRP